MASNRVSVLDRTLPADFQKALCTWLNEPGWTYGGYSHSQSNPPKYLYKHFSGVRRDGDSIDIGQVEQDLRKNAPLVYLMWTELKARALQGHQLIRCYANGYPSGTEGGIHQDSKSPGDFTTIFYPHLEWHPDWAGETVFFDEAASDIVACVYPKPNRLVLFPGTVPHAARGVSRACPLLRVTLMFKTRRHPV